MKKIIIIIALILPTLLQGQSILRGVILNKTSKEPIPFVAIGIEGTSTGTVSEESGKFQLDLSSVSPSNMKILVTSLGFEDASYEVNALQTDNIEILLEPKIFNLDEVVVYSGKGNIREIGKGKINTRMSVNFALQGKVNQNLGSEVGRRFKIKSSSQLETLKFYLSQNNFKGVKFRINIYKAESKGRLEHVHNQEIIISLNPNQKGWVEVDLRSYNIAVDDDIVASVEWIAAETGGNRLNIPITVPSIGNKHYYKYGSQNAWKKYNNMSAAMVLEVRE